MTTQTMASTGEDGPRPGEEIWVLGDRIVALAGQIAAAQAEFLAALGEFDATEGWKAYAGVRSAAHWLSWRAGMDLRTAREHLRVARRLRDLPLTAAALSQGRLSYSKARALARVCTSETEQDMVDIATHAPAAHVERLTRGLRTAARTAAHKGDPSAQEVLAPEQTSSRSRHRVQWRWDEEQGDLVLWGRLSAADGAVLLAGLTRSELERIRTLAQEEVPEDEVWRDRADLSGTAPAEVGPALVSMAQWCLGRTAAPAQAAAAEVVVLVGPANLAAGAGDTPADPTPDPAAAPAPQVPPTRTDGVPVTARVDTGPALSEDALTEVWCGASQRLVVASRSAVLDYGRRRRRFSPAQLRALHLRDRGCRTPGCGRTRFLHAHHIRFWSRGGPSDLDNAVLLCSTCHRAVHEKVLQIVALGGQQLQFRDARGAPMEAAPPTWGTADQLLTGETIEPSRVGGQWGGEPLRLSLATAVVLDSWIARSERRQAA